MSRALRVPPEPTPLATALYLGFCLLALALMASAADLLGSPYPSDSVLRATPTRAPPPPPPAIGGRVS
jgi:hypothetical protein